MEKELLITTIRLAFADVPYPGDDNISDPEGRDEGEGATEAFRGRSWQSLKLDELWVPSLYSMTPEAFHYFLPAYLIRSLEDEEDISDDLMSVLKPPTNIYSRNFFYSRYSKLTIAQKNVIQEYLNWTLKEIIKLNRELGVEGGGYTKLRTMIDFYKNH